MKGCPREFWAVFFFDQECVQFCAPKRVWRKYWLKCFEYSPYVIVIQSRLPHFWVRFFGPISRTKAQVKGERSLRAVQHFCIHFWPKKVYFGFDSDKWFTWKTIPSGLRSRFGVVSDCCHKGFGVYVPGGDSIQQFGKHFHWTVILNKRLGILRLQKVISVVVGNPIFCIPSLMVFLYWSVRSMQIYMLPCKIPRRIKETPLLITFHGITEA